ncbi:MAG TPA: asparaginase [Candidatus Limnocylindrales bacterium]
MPTVAVVFTGGTISMDFDPVAGGNVPTLDGAAILARTPGLADIARVVPIDRGLTPASHFTFADLLSLATVIEEAAMSGDVDGVVVVQGTDTIEETSFAWDLLHVGTSPVVVTGAMRASHETPYDGPANLRDAVAVAAAPVARGVGVVVTLAGTIEAADDVTKMHTTALDTFRSPNGGRLGRVEDATVTMERARGPRRTLATSAASERVHLVTAGIATDGSLIDAAVAAGAEGIVVAATGSGNTAPGMLAAAGRAMASGIPVVLASRCPSGAVGTAYAFPGGGSTWVAAGAIPTGTLCAIKARVALALGLGAGLSRDALTHLLADPEA